MLVALDACVAFELVVLSLLAGQEGRLLAAGHEEVGRLARVLRLPARPNQVVDFLGYVFADGHVVLVHDDLDGFPGLLV